MSHYDEAVYILRCVPVSNDALAVCEAILAVAVRVEALTDAVEALTAAHLAQPATRPAVVCPGCSTAHRDSGLLCDTCAVGRSA